MFPKQWFLIIIYHYSRFHVDNSFGRVFSKLKKKKKKIRELATILHAFFEEWWESSENNEYIDGFQWMQRLICRNRIQFLLFSEDTIIVLKWNFPLSLSQSFRENLHVKSTIIRSFVWLEHWMMCRQTAGKIFYEILTTILPFLQNGR